MSMDKGLRQKQTSLSLEQKINIINNIESGKNQSVVAKLREINKQTVNAIWQDREKLNKAYEACTSNNCKRLCTAAFEEVEETLLKWFTVVRSQNIPVNGPLLCDKTQELAKLLKHDLFQCSESWLNRFKVRHNIVFREVCGEEASASKDVVGD